MTPWVHLLAYQLQRQLSLIVLISGLCSSQLHAHTCQPAWAAFLPNFLMLFSLHLAKNEWEGHHLKPKVIPIWLETDFHHILCLVVALCHYMSLIPQALPEALSVRLNSLQLCIRLTLTKILSYNWGNWPGQSSMNPECINSHNIHVCS